MNGVLLQHVGSELLVCTHGEFALTAADRQYLIQDGRVAPVARAPAWSPAGEPAGAWR